MLPPFYSCPPLHQFWSSHEVLLMANSVSVKALLCLSFHTDYLNFVLFAMGTFAGSSGMLAKSWNCRRSRRRAVLGIPVCVQVLQSRFSLPLPQCHEKEPKPTKAVNGSTEGSLPGLSLNRSSPLSYTHSPSYIMYIYTVIAG